ANTSAAVASSSRRSRSVGPVASKPTVHQSWPRARTSVSSTSHRGSWPAPGARATIGPLASGNRLMRRLLRTGLQPAGPPLGGPAAAGAERADGKGPLLPGLHPAVGAARHLEDSRAPAVHLHLKRAAPADLHRHPAQLRIQQVGILA